MEIVPYNDTFKDQMTSVWERSVRATHGFLIPADIDYFKTIVSGIDYKAFNVYCLVRGNVVAGFIGLDNRKIEMLFLAPEYIGQGHGTSLMNFALNKLHADQVDVNEQNLSAVKFYSKFGFVAYDRTEKDPEGKDYPILKMRLSS